MREDLYVDRIEEAYVVLVDPPAFPDAETKKLVSVEFLIPLDWWHLITSAGLYEAVADQTVARFIQIDRSMGFSTLDEWVYAAAEMGLIRQNRIAMRTRKRGNIK